MTQRERILSVYSGQTPDAVPFMLDLSHWYYHRHRKPWDLSTSYLEPEKDLIDYHREMGAGFYVPNLGSFFSVSYPDDVIVTTTKIELNGSPAITWKYETPVGSIERTRVWEESSYSWAIVDWTVETEEDLKVLEYALASRKFQPHFDRWEAWRDYVGDLGVVNIITGYSAMGQLLNYWMGVEGTMYATFDWPETVRGFIDRVNANNLDFIRMLAASPAEVVMMGDNFSCDIQPPSFFNEWSRDYYVEAVKILHAAGKYVPVHIDGRLRGALSMIRDTGADCADAVTPKPMGDLNPEECRAEAGPDFILSGGVPPNLWLPEVDVEVFKASVLRWLELRKISPRLIANAGDQVPPGAAEDRIEIMRDLVEARGRY